MKKEQTSGIIVSKITLPNRNKEFTHRENLGAAISGEKFVRLLFYGGGRNHIHNATFFYAMLNVVNDYLPKDKKINSKNVQKTGGYVNYKDKTIKTANGEIKIFFIAEGGKFIVDKINEQTLSIQSIDFFSHGGTGTLYLMDGASMEKSFKEGELKRAYLYSGKVKKAFSFHEKSKNSGVINDIKYKKFTESSKIEIHGCNTAGETEVVDNLCTNLSQGLFSAGRKRAVVIGHDDSSGPEIKINTSTTEADYRQGVRLILLNGKTILTTKQKGRLSATTINKAIDENN